MTNILIIALMTTSLGFFDVSNPEASLMLSITPGKPGAPTESMQVIKKANEVTLILKRTQSDKKSQEETIKITLEEFDALWKIVSQKHLEQFRPEEKNDNVADFGEIELKLSQTPKPKMTPIVHKVSWTRPLKNQRTIAPLLSQMAKLAQNRGRKVRFIYLSQLKNY